MACAIYYNMWNEKGFYKIDHVLKNESISPFDTDTVAAIFIFANSPVFFTYRNLSMIPLPKQPHGVFSLNFRKIPEKYI